MNEVNIDKYNNYRIPKELIPIFQVSQLECHTQSCEIERHTDTLLNTPMILSAHYLDGWI